MLNVSPRHRNYETLPGINNPSFPAVAPLPGGDTEDTKKIVARFGEDILAAGEDYWQTMWDLREQIKVDFDEAGITIPYPQRDVHMVGEKKVEREDVAHS